MSPAQWLAILALMILLPACSSDKISSLPGQPPVRFSQYSGYITVDDAQGRELFYYFVEAEADPILKPLVLWLNGGPGCSSVGAGAFGEHGPFQPRGDLLVRNLNSWNKEANMIYLESPAGVGFSYSSDESYYNSVDDEMTARDNLVFLQKWIEEFPSYKDRDLYITGESYAGHYVPQLAQLVVQSGAFKLKGIAIGNPLIEFNTDFNSRAEYFWSHGLVSDSSYDNFNKICNYSQIRRQFDTAGKLNPPCSDVWHQASSEIGNHVNAYDVILDVCLSATGAQSQLLSHLGTEKVDVCIGDEIYKYLNRKEVQKALHARLVGVGNWSACSDVLNYEMQELQVPMVPILGNLVKSGVRVLVYSGDQDSVIPLLGTRTLVHGLAKDLGLKTSTPYRSWFQDKQVAGWTQEYGDNLAFATIRGAAHQAPFSQPERSLVLFSSFVAGKSLPKNGHAKRDSSRSHALLQHPVD